MGDISEMMLEGTLCQSCGEFIDDGCDDGYPRDCAGCKGEQSLPTPKPRTKEELDAHSVLVQDSKRSARTLRNRRKKQRQKANRRARLEAEKVGREE